MSYDSALYNVLEKIVLALKASESALGEAIKRIDQRADRQAYIVSQQQALIDKMRVRLDVMERRMS